MNNWLNHGMAILFIALLAVDSPSQALRFWVLINLLLAYLNLLPIPPLDGSKVLAGFLPREQAIKLLNFGRYGFIVIAVLLFTGLLGKVIAMPLNYSFVFVVNTFGLAEGFYRFMNVLN